MTNMKKIAGLAMVLVMAMLLNVPSAFAWHFDLRNSDDNRMMVELYFTADSGGSAIDSFNFAFGYDGDLEGPGDIAPPDPNDELKDTLDWSLETYNFYLTSMTEGGVGATHYAPQDVVNNFSASGGSGTLTGETKVADFTFTGEAVTDGYADMWWSRAGTYYNSIMSGDSTVYHTSTYSGLFIDSTGANVADVEAVPIPGAVFLLGSALLGFIGIRKKLSA